MHFWSSSIDRCNTVFNKTITIHKKTEEHLRLFPGQEEECFQVYDSLYSKESFYNIYLIQALFKLIKNPLQW